MIKNDYITELELEFDYDKLKEVVAIATDSNFRVRQPSSLKSHQFLVNEFEYMKGIYSKFSFLSPVFNIYNLQPGRGMPIHLDAGRDCAINIPIVGTENTYTVFYKFINQTDGVDNIVTDVWSTIKRDHVQEVFRFTLTRPTLVNTSNFPHSVENNSIIPRVVISLSVSKKITFQNVNQILGY